MKRSRSGVTTSNAPRHHRWLGGLYMSLAAAFICLLFTITVQLPVAAANHQALTVNRLTTTLQTPVISGTYDPSLHLQIKVGGITYTLGSSPMLRSEQAGIWSLDLSSRLSPLAPGTYNVVATSKEDQATTARATESLTIAPVAPEVLSGTVDKLITTARSPALSGTVNSPSATVIVHISDLALPAHNNGNGTWTLPADTITPALADGTYEVQLALTDGDRNGTDTTTNELVITSTAPSGTIDPLSTLDQSPALSGTVSTPDAAIEITVNNATYTATNAGDGTWRLPAGIINPGLSPGRYVVIVVFRDPANNLSAQTVRDSLEILAPPVVLQTTQKDTPIDPIPLPLMSTDPPKIDPTLYVTTAPHVPIQQQPEAKIKPEEPLSIPRLSQQFAKDISEGNPNTIVGTVAGTGVALLGTPWALLAWRRIRQKNIDDVRYVG